MKSLLTTLLLFVSVSLLAQNEVWNSLPINTNLNAQNYDLEMVDGKVYATYYRNVAGNDEIAMDRYNPKTMAWEFVHAVSLPAFAGKIITEKQNDQILICTYVNSDFMFYQFDKATQTINNLAPAYTHIGVNGNWMFHAGKNVGEYYVLYTFGTGPSEVHGLEFDDVLNQWTPMMENASSDLSTASLRIQSSDTKVFFGVYSTKVRMTFFNKGDITTMFSYDGGATGELFADGNTWNNRRWLFTGNKNDVPSFYGTSDINNSSYEVLLDGTTININTATDPITDFNLDSMNIAWESSPSHTFIFSNFSANGLGNPNEKLQVIRRDIAAGAVIWDTVSTPVAALGTPLENNSLHLTIDNAGLHLAAGYTISGGSLTDIRVSNHEPYILNGTDVALGGLCPGNVNEIYNGLQIADDDYDPITILSATSVNGLTSAINIIPDGYSSGIHKFRIVGLPLSGNDLIQIVFTDGYDTYTANLGTYNAAATPVNVQFISDPVLLCANERQIELSELVNYYDGGVFRINGLEISNGFIDASSLSIQNGTLRYRVNVNGCFITAQGNYAVVNPPTISISSSPSECGLNTGSASSVITPGSAPGYTYYWSTGEQTAAISNLAPGPYYIHAIDDNGCKATELANVQASAITVSSTVVNPTCHNIKDGSIALTVSGVSNYQVVWSNGHFGDNVSNLRQGNYEFTLYTTDGCEVKQSFQLTAPPALTNSFSTVRPDCGTANGSITSNISGGTPTYSYAWNSGQTSVGLSGQNQGFYVLTVTDANGCVLKDSLSLNEKAAPLISDSVIAAGCNMNNGGINASIVQDPTGDPIQSIIWSEGSTTEDIYNLSAGAYIVTATSTSGCISQKAITVPTAAPALAEICVVTVDEATTTNLVVWEKPEVTDISFYNIYRENTDAGLYAWIDTVQYTNLSVFNDVIASPLHRSWRYRISAVNHCGVESPISPEHKTLHLNTIEEVTPGVIGIYWDAYEGLSAAEYIVHRYTDQNGWVDLSPAVPFGSTTSFMDTPPVGETGLDYYVSLDLDSPCTATYRAQDFNTSRSNKEKGVFNPGSGTGNSSNELPVIAGDHGIFTVYPNPFQDQVTVRLQGNMGKAWVNITDMHGKVVKRVLCAQGESKISTSSLDQGVYFISMERNGIRYVNKMIK